MIADIRGYGVSTLAPQRGNSVKGGGGGNGLSNGLLAYWKMDENNPGDIRVDSVGANNLLDDLGFVGSAGPGSGIINNCAGNFRNASNTARLICADNAAVGIGAGKSFTFTAWRFMDSVSVVCSFITKWDDTTHQDYNFYANTGGDGHLYWNYSATQLGGTSVLFASSAGPNGFISQIGSWQLVAFGYDDVLQQLWMQTSGDSVSLNTLGSRISLACAGVHRTTAPLIVGNYVGSGLAFKGWIDEVALWGRSLSEDEVKLVFNNRTGLPLSAFT
jgi:hypothetical protein